MNMLALEYDRFKGYPDEKVIQKQMQTYHTLQAKAADLDQEKLSEKRMSIRPQKEEEAQKRISDMYGNCQDNFFRHAKMRLPSALESSLRILKSTNPIGKLFLHRAGSKVGGRKMIEKKDKGKGGKSEDFQP